MIFKKIARYFLYTLLAAVVGFNVWIFATGKTHFYPTLYHNFADIDDYLVFTNDTLHPSDKVWEWPHAGNYNKDAISPELKPLLDSLETIALVVIKDDSLVHEEYWDGYSDHSYSNSFSMAKTWVSVLTGVALKQGHIKSLDQPVADFLPSFKEGGKEKITIRHLLTMGSGLKWDESYGNPLSTTSALYYGHDLMGIVNDLQVEKEPGKEFSYKSVDTQILGAVLEKATGMHLAAYAEKYLWQPMGAKGLALWSTDHDKGLAKSYCCLNTNALDFARLGKLYLDSGKWNGTPIVDADYVTASLQPVNMDDIEAHGTPVKFYGYQWWLMADLNRNIFYARGILGQYMIVIPDKRIIIVRLGKHRGPKEGNHYKEMLGLVKWGESL
jgi:CubicO group peptidase (beta-lactamase class C family)